MKHGDWDGHKITVKAHCLDLKHGEGVHIRLRAAWEEEARREVAEILSTHHGPFMRISQGHYKLAFERL